MLPWKFFTYEKDGGRNDVQAVIDGYADDDYALASLSRAVAHLAVTPKAEWHEPQAKKLKGQDPLYEIRYQAGRCETRALGYFGPEEGAFTIFGICTHKQRVYSPPGAFKSAQDKISHLKKGTGRAVPLKIDGEHFPSNDKEADC